MFANLAISYLNGWNILIGEKHQEWKEIQDGLRQMTEETLRDPAISAPSHRKNTPIEVPTVYNLQHCWNHLIDQLGWRDVRIQPRAQGALGLLVRNVKNRVGASLLAFDYAPQTFSSWLLVDVPRATYLGVCDVSVLLVPETIVREIVDADRGFRPMFSSERAQAQLADLLPLRHAAPFVIIGFSQTSSVISVDEIAPLPDSSDGIVEKCIEFPQEYYQAGVGILSYFGEILKQKHPELKARIRIEQEGLIVRMLIEAGNGDKEIIEKTLQQYVLVVTEQEAPESLLDNKLQIFALQNKLELANLEIRQMHKLFNLQEGTYSARIGHLEEEVSFLRQQIGSQLDHLSGHQRLLASQNKSHERVLLAHLRSSEVVIGDLLNEARANASLYHALRLLDDLVQKGVSAENEAEIKTALQVIRTESPTLFDEVGLALRNITYSVSGNYLYQWFQIVASL